VQLVVKKPAEFRADSAGSSLHKNSNNNVNISISSRVETYCLFMCFPLGISGIMKAQEEK